MELAVIVLGIILVVREVAHHKEREGLLDRIQAPEIAVDKARPRPESRLPDDDFPMLDSFSRPPIEDGHYQD